MDYDACVLHQDQNPGQKHYLKRGYLLLQVQGEDHVPLKVEYTVYQSLGLVAEGGSRYFQYDK